MDERFSFPRPGACKVARFQTYRLGWTEQCKDGTKMGVGMPEYLLLFRRPPTDNSNSYADTPVVKTKEDYSRGRWQIDAHGFMRVDGDRLLTPEEIKSLPLKTIYRAFRNHSLTTIYDYEKHVRLAEEMDENRRLRTDFMVIPPQSWHPDVWTDVSRMRTLNGSQAQKGRQMHICPLQFDIVDRAINQYSMKGDVVFDPFAGLMTVPYRAITLERFGIGCELNRSYWRDGVSYCEAAEQKANVPSLFDLPDEDEEEMEVAA